MNVASLRFTRRINTGNYEFEEIAVEVVPDDGQTADELLQDTRAFIEANKPGAKGAPVSNGKPSTAPPLANKAAKKQATKEEDHTPPFSQGSTTQTAGNGPPKGPPTNGKKRGRGRPPKAFTEAKQAVENAMDSDNLEEFLERLNEARERATAFTVDEWDSIMKDFAGVYRGLNDPECDPETVTAIVNAFKSEKTALETRRSGKAAA